MASVLDRFLPARLGRRVRWLAAAAWTSNLGDGINLAAGPLLIASATHRAFLVAFAALLQGLPWVLIGLWAGVIVDRVDRRALIAASEAFRLAVLAVLVLVLTGGHVAVPVVLAALFALGIADVFTNTTTSTLLPMLVDADDLGVANSRVQGGFVVSQQLAGPPLGAALFAVGRAWPFFAQGVFVASALAMIWRIGAQRVPVAPRTERRVLADVREGLVWLIGHAAVRTLALVIFVFNVTWGASWSVLVLDVLDRLHMGQVGYGALTAAAAVGGILAMAIYPRLEGRWSLANLMRACLTLEVLTHLALALDTIPWVAYVVMFDFGAYAFVWLTVSSTVRQRAVPTALQGRVASVYLMGVFGGVVIGQLFGGLIASAGGIVAAFWFAFGGSALTLVWIWPRMGAIAAAEAPAAETPAPA